MKTDINKEAILIRYLNDMLSYGITTGVTMEDYNKLLNSIIKSLKLSSFKMVEKVKVDPSYFNSIIQKANKLGNTKEEGIILQKIDGTYIAKPTYYLEKNQEIAYKLDPIVNVVIRNRVTKNIDNIKYSSFDISQVPEHIIGIAAKVSAYYVNDLIERYVNSQIQSFRWPIQCKDIDEFIFKKDIARFINEQGTSKAFKRAYLQAMKITCELIRDAYSNSEFEREIYFSNDEKNILAFANYRKITMPKKLEFLRNYKYSKYEANDEPKSLSIIGDKVYSSKNMYIYSSNQERLPGDRETLLNDDDVKIMQRRLTYTQER